MADRVIQISQPDTGLEEWNAVRGPIERGWLTQGPCVAEFERAFAARIGARHAIATSNCTTALHLILAAMGVGPGDEVIVPAFTWVATANVVVYCGATPVFADVSRRNFNVDPNGLAALVTPRTRAIIAVHLFGRCAEIDAIAAAVPGIPVIEDAACAAGSSYRGREAGCLGVAGAFSFHPRKSITTGEGGMVTTADDGLAERVNMLRNHGASISEEQRHNGPQPYLLPDFNLLGFNYRMTDLQGAVGAVQLRKLDQYIAERDKWARFYHDQLSAVAWLRLPEIPSDGVHGWQSFVCYVDPAEAPLPRNEMMSRLLAAGINTRPGTHAVHLLGYYRDRFGLRPDDFPAARDCDRQSMAIPLHNRMSPDDFSRIVDALRQM